MKKILTLLIILVCFSGCGKETATVDLDLSKSETVAYSGILNISEKPDEYLGKTIRIKGTSASIKDDSNGKTYYACLVMDSTSCCSVALEYALADKSYPEDNKSITVSGKLGSYELAGATYYSLTNAILEKS